MKTLLISILLFTGLQSFAAQTPINELLDACGSLDGQPIVVLNRKAKTFVACAGVHAAHITLGQALDQGLKDVQMLISESCEDGLFPVVSSPRVSIQTRHHLVVMNEFVCKK